MQDHRLALDYSLALRLAVAAVSPLCLASLSSALGAHSRRGALPSSGQPAEARPLLSDDSGGREQGRMEDGDDGRGPPSSGLLLQLAGLVEFSSRAVLYNRVEANIPSAPDLTAVPIPSPVTIPEAAASVDGGAAQGLHFLQHQGSASGLLGGLVLGSLSKVAAAAAGADADVAVAIDDNCGVKALGPPAVTAAASPLSGRVSVSDILPIRQGFLEVLRQASASREGGGSEIFDASCNSPSRMADDGFGAASSFFSAGVAGGGFAGCCNPACINLDKMSEAGLGLKPYVLEGSSRWVCVIPD